MARHECRHEQDVLDAVRTGRWPLRCDADLVAHVSACSVCTDVAIVATAFSAEVDAEGEQLAAGPALPPLPPAGLVWWRAQRRAREEALRKATWPVRVAQGVALVSALATVVTLSGALAGWAAGWGEWLAGNLPSLSFSVADLATLSPPMRAAIVLLVVAVLAITPAAIYLGVVDE